MHVQVCVCVCVCVCGGYYVGVYVRERGKCMGVRAS